MKLRIIFLSFLSVAAATGCFQTVDFILPPEDTDVQDDGQDQDARPDSPEPPDAAEGVGDAADIEDGETFEPYPAGDFTLTDYNADSPTYLQERTLSAARGKVVVLFFLSYG